MKKFERYSTTPGKKSGRKSWAIFFGSFGLLCLVQAVLNISLRLTYNCCGESELKLESKPEVIINSSSQEHNQLRQFIFDNYTQQGWLYVNRSFYYFSVIKKSWWDSRNDCVQRGADLVIINNEAEQDFIRLFKRMTWIGLTDADSEGNWTWVDGTPLNTSYWYTDEPNSYLGLDEDCGEVRMFESQNSWNDAFCKNINFWVCEKKIDP